MKSNPTIAVIGLGYVGLPLAAAFSKAGNNVIGFDIDESRVGDLNNSVLDRNGEVSYDDLLSAALFFTCDPNKLSNADIYIITVPTPTVDGLPDTSCLENAMKTIAPYICHSNIVVIESTVYPGLTRQLCSKFLPKAMNFHFGYSPERINPGDKVHTLKNVTKIVSGHNRVVADYLAEIYGRVCDSIHIAPSIEVAEMAKVIENTQRDINIAFMNELSMICRASKLNFQAVLDAAKTKWNFLDFTSGLVAGHCIPEDPYYLAQFAKKHGVEPIMTLAGRQTNDDYPRFIAMEIIKAIVKHDISSPSIVIFGVAFKENVKDFRNNKTVDIYRRLKELDLDVILVDPLVDAKAFELEYGIPVHKSHGEKCCDIVVLAVTHDEICYEFTGKVFALDAEIVIDVKSKFKPSDFDATYIGF